MTQYISDIMNALFEDCGGDFFKPLNSHTNLIKYVEADKEKCENQQVVESLDSLASKLREVAFYVKDLVVEDSCTDKLLCELKIEAIDRLPHFFGLVCRNYLKACDIDTVAVSCIPKNEVEYYNWAYERQTIRSKEYSIIIIKFYSQTK